MTQKEVSFKRISEGLVSLWRKRDATSNFSHSQYITSIENIFADNPDWTQKSFNEELQKRLHPNQHKEKQPKLDKKSIKNK